MTVLYETERLVLKVLDPSYGEMAADFYIRNKEFLEEWEPLKKDDYFTAEYHEKQLAKDMKYFESGSLLRLWIFKKESPDKIIGCVTLNNIVRGVFLSCHLGYKMDREEINKGYMTEAVKKIVEVAFDELKLHRIEANIMPRNKRSLRVAEKLGFFEEGSSGNYLKINGRWEDHIHMVMLNQ